MPKSLSSSYRQLTVPSSHIRQLMAACSASFWDSALWPICTHVYCYLPQTQVKIKSLKIKTKNLMCPVPPPPATQRCFDCVSMAGHSSGMGSALSVVAGITHKTVEITTCSVINPEPVSTVLLPLQNVCAVHSCALLDWRQKPASLHHHKQW